MIYKQNLYNIFLSTISTEIQRLPQYRWRGYGSIKKAYKITQIESNGDLKF